MANKVVLNKRTNVEGRKPSTDIMEYGEIALNYHKDSESIFFKNDNDEIVEFKDNKYYHKIIEDNELVTAQSLTQIKDNVGLGEDGSYTPISDSNYIKEAKTIVHSTELLDNALKNVEEQLNDAIVNSDEIYKNLVSVTYAELVTLRDNAELVPGTWYRVTDYVTTTSQENTDSIGHQFDVLALATDIDTLSEEAKAIQHEGDTYFNDSNLDAWKIWYSLDNDNNRFKWASDYNYINVASAPQINPLLISDSDDSKFATSFEPSMYMLMDEDNNVTNYEPTTQYDVIIGFGYAYDKELDIDNLYLQHADYPTEEEYNPEDHPIDEDDLYFYRGRTVVDDVEYDYWIKCEYNNESNGAYSNKYILTDVITTGDASKKMFSCRIKPEYSATTSDIGYEFREEDLFVALEKLNDSNGNVTFNLYKTDVISGLGTAPDYSEYYTYYGTEEIENVIYDKWVSEVSSDRGDFTVYAYTKRIIKNNDIDLDAIKNTGVIYRMIDEYGNDCPYDFKNIVFKRKLTDGVIDNENGVDTFVYTFSWVDTNGEGGVYDFSIKGNNGDLKTAKGEVSGCYGNEIGNWRIEYAESDKIQYGLNDNVFISNYPSTEQCGTYNNKLLNDCYSNSFGDYCSNNSFSGNCYSNSFGEGCTSNSFGDNCYHNSFGNDCYSNSFGNECYYNSFGNDCYSNSFGNECYYNSFGNNCYHNSFGNYCPFNSFGDYYYYNSFGNNCFSNSFGDRCVANSFGNSCASNSFGNSCVSNSFSEGCWHNSFRMSDSKGGKLRDYCYNNIFEDEVSYVVLYNTSTSSISYELRNVTVCQGMSGTSRKYNIVEISDLNADYQINVGKDEEGNVHIYTLQDFIDIEETLVESIDSIKGSVGLTDNLDYNPSENSNYISNSTNISESIEILDNELGNNVNLIVTTYSELVELRDNGKLIPGSWYRITDYVTTTSQANTKSAGHQFDVLVLATDIDTLSEEAKAIQHEGDAYFDEANLEAWRIWYSLDNDKSKFGWACNPIETVYTYECTYNDTDYILGRTSSMNSGDKTYYCWAPLDGSEILFFTEIENPTENCTLYDEYLTEIGTLIVTSETVEVGKGVIYRMIDERNNDCPYDFKNMQFIPSSLITSGSGSDAGSGYAIGEFSEEGIATTTEETTEENSDELTELLDVSEVIYYYTFDLNSSSDYSLTFEKCYGNVIKEYVNSNGTRELNGIVFKNITESSTCYSNSFGTDCYSNSFGNRCYNNSFGDECSYNSLGDGCSSNTFGEGCKYNSFGNGCSSNTFGNECFYISFGDACWNNSFGNSYRDNSFGNSCQYNSFGEGCTSNSFGDSCQYNSFGNQCYSNSFGNSCQYNSFGEGCKYNSFGNQCHDNSFGEGCQYNSFRMSDSQDNDLRNYCYNNIFENGVNYVVLYNTNTASYSYKLQNVTVCQGMSGTVGKYNIVEIPTLNTNYQTKVAKNTNGDIKVYCEADLIQ